MRENEHAAVAEGLKAGLVVNLPSNLRVPRLAWVTFKFRVTGASFAESRPNYTLVAFGRRVPRSHGRPSFVNC